MYLSISNEQRLATIAANIVMREREVMSYDLNIINYESMLAGMTAEEWPDHLAQYKTATLDQVPDEYDQAVADLQWRDRIRGLLKTERAERAKSFSIYQALLNHIPEADRQAAVDAALAREAARMIAQQPA